MKNILIKLKQLFCLYITNNNKSLSDLEKRIIKAKQIVKYTSYGNMIFLENYQEVRKVLQYEDTLVMALYVREFIVRQTSTIKCIEYLCDKS